MPPILLTQLQPTEPPAPLEIPAEPLPPAEIPSSPAIPVTLEDLKSFLEAASSTPGWLTQPWATLFASLAVLGSGYLVYRNGNKTRKQAETHFGTSHDLEVTRSLRDRFTTIAGQLADPASAVRTAGVYAMEALANDWLARGDKSEAQACINVLCSYVRTPYAPPQGRGQNQTNRIIRTSLTDRVVEEHYEYRQDDREVRQSIIRTIAAHLKVDGKGNWSDLDFDFTGAHLDNADFSHAIFNKPARFERAQFFGSSARFVQATFTASADFSEARFYSVLTIFEDVKFHGPNNKFYRAKFGSRYNRFDRVKFTGGITNFTDCEFEGEDTAFDSARFESGNTLFTGAKLRSIRTWFNEATFESATSFDRSTFHGEAVSFDQAQFRGQNTTFHRAEFSGGLTSFNAAEFRAEITRFGPAKFNGDQTSFDKSTFGDTRAKFGGTEFNSVRGTTFHEARFIGGRIDFGWAIFNGPASFERPEVWANVEFDWSAQIPYEMRKRKPQNVLPDIWPPALMDSHGAEAEEEQD
ncbi:pentapeptide repeat-containing protein (plasmid) [Rhodococcus pseudokoreensis]|uniref:Pentapeptide repeat-containing protein n=1 Tax=Rhodococcus pseudokoreensis TaxID=2811421 RepID=A0A974ZRI4_9NOCA|nr:pentapeptide repeat-containing protein [Rhodococcus pseudokoreensis]QSE87546.1 pentapeptide repeat-containing protein [Rhodococcus pseudokoreensis]